ncbi:hypothetical protein X801_00604 [Opisthorchis viverrini]|uniref:Integrase catalytic domain-containing protein n=1 Tax=Opisthorchis viverrini TaxID=6198 RepID=A0A1S8X9X3_OPIVI|nr:hypothetical protein X801_00604 [Opisthorchis viverrini]
MLDRTNWKSQDVADLGGHTSSVRLRCSVNRAECGQVKERKPSAPAPLQTIKAGFSNELVGVGIIGPLPRTDRGNIYILVMVDNFTKWCEAIPIPKIDASTMAKKLLTELIARWGVSYQIHTDQGSKASYSKSCATY